tara:strand:+ start:314 stop:448 length:135 start_codon:yes stop_codon:yes gene_type:complete
MDNLNFTIESPCKEICAIDKDSGLCVGYGLTYEQKIIILEKLNK